ncbi:hypothetical protein M514_08846, partial [Trichuris suis]
CLARRPVPQSKMRCSPPCRKVPRCCSSKNTDCSTVRRTAPAVTQCPCLCRMAAELLGRSIYSWLKPVMLIALCI